jgi:flagella basal body P-ring formation protein FlgA
MFRSVFSKAAALGAVLAIAAGATAAAGAQLVTLPVPSVTIYPGDLIDAGRLSDHAFLQSQIGNGYVGSQEDLVGKVARRTLLPGHPIAENAVREVDLVVRGTAVQLVFQQPGLTITTYASPLQDGGVGDLIRLRNTDSGAVVVGIVQRDGTVRVGAQ